MHTTSETMAEARHTKQRLEKLLLASCSVRANRRAYLKMKKDTCEARWTLRQQV